MHHPMHVLDAPGLGAIHEAEIRKGEIKRARSNGRKSIKRLLNSAHVEKGERQIRAKDQRCHSKKNKKP